MRAESESGVISFVFGDGFQIEAHPDPFLCSMAHWVLEDYSSALDTLLQQPAADPGSPGTASETSRSRSLPLPPGLSRIHFIYPGGGKLRGSPTHSVPQPHRDMCIASDSKRA